MFKAQIKKETYEIDRAGNPLAVKGKTAKVKYKKLKKKNQKLAVSKIITFTKKGQGTMSYKLVSAKKGSKSFQEEVQDQCQNRQGDHQEKTEERHLQAESQCQSGR